MPLNLALRNALRHKLRTTLTMLGLAVAIMAYGLLNTVIDAWYANARHTSDTRLITRSAISLMYPLPISYADSIRRVEGVRALTWMSWFGGTYLNQRKPFALFAVDARHYFALFPEFGLSAADRQRFEQDKQGAVIGPQLARRFGFRVGDVIPIQGDRYPGNWHFVVEAIYTPRDAQTDQTMMLVHWDLLRDTLRQRLGTEGLDRVGLFVVGVDDPAQAARVALRIDALFHNSAAQTRTETEKSYQLSIVSMSHNILMGIQAVGIVLMLIIVAVMGNTMSMSAAERTSEYATLKALGFTPGFITRLLLTESLIIGVTGGVLGMLLTYPASAALVAAVGSLEQGFYVAPSTLLAQTLLALGVSVVAALWPAWRMSHLNLPQAFRRAA
jgi:putative ABC transport system permease protein